MSVKIKICGLTRECDADAVNAAMPDYAGLVFYEKSRRCLTAEQAHKIRLRLSDDIKAVGVFVNMPPQKVAELAKSVPLDIAQLHGEEDNADIEKLRALCPELEIWKAARVGDDFEKESLKEYSTADRLLLDAYVEGYGGEGKKIEDDKLEGINLSQIILAGGLNAWNIADAINMFHPYGVDVSSGVETDDLKDEAKIKEIVDIVRKIK